MMSLEIRSSAFEDGAFIPKEHTADGTDISPPLQWTGAPPGTESFALICEDPDAPGGTWVHWVMWGIGAQTNQLPEGIPTKQELPGGPKQGTNDFRKIGYSGPAPPPGMVHRYLFKLHALDKRLSLKLGAKKSDLLRAMKGHTLLQTELMGRYKR